MIWLVPTDRIVEVWPDAEPILRPVTELPACRCTLKGTFAKLRTGQRQLFVSVEQGTIVAAAVTCITSYDVGDWLTVVLCGGKGLEEWGREGIEAIEDWAEQCGCIGVEMIGRDGWAKALGYERTAAVIQKVA
ncbi:MAG: hypothetical protein A4E20_04795 [Nitrospira sp. SG-bin2]|uniref:hypothetical protein n=1 Tax=Nitrospira cf. moscoviensis SBR1015 TaxID=96242 RepID=UPI000A0C652E|nr:hypothetical protein [Nitrospira cf. moscoviensis SBR1015]OQW38095.1 MAG: hypothetical protein A4E20_04795 [Nitrospira sp. SG-bin2]